MAHLHPFLGPPVPSFLEKHPHVGKRKLRDTVGMTKTQYISRKIRKKRTSDDNTNLKRMFESRTIKYDW